MKMREQWTMSKEHAEELGNALLDAASDKSPVCQIVSVQDKLVSLPIKGGQYLVNNGAVRTVLVHDDRLSMLNNESVDDEHFDNNVVSLR